MANTSDIVKGRYSSYALLNEVGHGGSARVFRAQDMATKREVAVKQLFGNRPEDRADWLREVDALTTLNNYHCPHVVQYLDHMQQHGRLFLVGEYAEHGSLLHRLRHEGPLSESAVCDVVSQILTALHRMSAWGVVHGDLKASNVLLFEGLRVKLTDFALRSRRGAEEGERSDDRKQHDDNDGVEEDESTLVDRQLTTATTASTSAGGTSPLDVASSDSRLSAGLTRSRTAITASTAAPSVVPDSAVASPSAMLDFRGSVYWAAPEVLAGETKATAASDVWAVACTAVELLTGRPPYFDRTLPNATHHVLKHYYAVTEPETVAVAAASVDDKEGQGGRSGPGSAEAVAEAPPHVLLPPLPDALHLSEECVDFLRSCLQLRPADRPTAGALLQHPWFLDVVVPQMLRAAREGRVTSGEEEAVLGNLTNTGPGTAASTNVNTGNSGGRFAVIERWVEANLLSTQEARCAAWLQGDALPLLVPVLTPRIMTPTYIGNVMQCFAHCAEATSPMAALFLNRLGATELWSVEELTSACDADHLVTIFRCCCALQDPQVPVFTPTQPAALRFVLGLEKAKVLECVAALHHLLMDPGAAGGAGNGEDGEHQQQQQLRRTRARERLLRDGGAAVLCHRVEAQCKTAFVSGTAPTLEWATVHRLLAMVATVEPLPGGPALLFGLVGEGSVGPAAAPAMTPRSDTANAPNTNSGHHSVSPSTVGAETAAQTHAQHQPPSSVSPFSATPRSSPSPVNSALAGAKSHSATPAGAAGAGAGGASSTTAAPGKNHTTSNLNCTGSAVHNVSSSNFGLGPASPGATTTAADVAWTASLTWMLAVQEAAHHGSDAAVLLLTRYIPHVGEGGRVDYLQKAGVSLAATLVFVASNPTVSTTARCAAVASLPALQATSLRVARYLRDPVRCIPLLAETLHHAAPVPPLVEALLSALRALTAEKQTLAAAASSPWMWAALIALLPEEVSSVDGGRSASAAAATGNRDGSVSSSSSSVSLTDAGRNPSPTRPRRDQTDPRTRGTVTKTAITTAVLADLLALVEQWFADFSPLTLLTLSVSSSSSSACALVPPLPAMRDVVSPQSHLRYHYAASSSSGGNPGVVEGAAAGGAASPPPLTLLFATLRGRLKSLLERGGALTEAGVQPRVEAVLGYLTTRDAAAASSK